MQQDYPNEELNPTSTVEDKALIDSYVHLELFGKKLSIFTSARHAAAQEMGLRHGIAQPEFFERSFPIEVLNEDGSKALDKDGGPIFEIEKDEQGNVVMEFGIPKLKMETKLYQTYKGYYRDCVIVLYLCAHGEDKAIDAMANSKAALLAAFAWAEANKIRPGEDGYSDATAAFNKLMNPVRNSTGSPDTDELPDPKEKPKASRKRSGNE